MAGLFDDLSPTQLGATISIAPGEERGIIRAYGADQRAQMLTLTVSILEIDQLQLQLICNPFIQVTGKVRWGVGGQQNFAEFDVDFGAVLSVPASFVEVSVRNDGAAATGGPDPDPGIVTVSASVASGVRAPTGIPGAFRTVAYPLISGGALSDKRLIPRWAVAGVLVFTPADATATLVISDTSGQSLYNVTVNSGESFPVVSPGWAVQINNNNVLAINARIQYALML